MPVRWTSSRDWRADELQDDLEIDQVRLLTAREAQNIRAANPQASVLRILCAQVIVAGVVAGLVWAVTGRTASVWSALYGGLAVVVPAALFARGIARHGSAPHAGAAFASFFVWELVKIVVTVAMLAAAPRVVADVSWLALLACFVVTMKVYWVAMWLHSAQVNSVKKSINKLG